MHLLIRIILVLGFFILNCIIFTTQIGDRESEATICCPESLQFDHEKMEARGNTKLTFLCF